MPYVVVCATALLASGLTLFSGFGLGTLLLPAFALFFPLPVAVAATAVVHLANNLFKLGLMGRYAQPKVVLRFGTSAALFAFVGAAALTRLAERPPWFTWHWGERAFLVEPLGVVVALLMVVFALLELLPVFERLQWGSAALEVGGALSGFFGGLSGHQGALRSAFLTKSGLDRDAFVGTGVVCAVVVDVVRLGVYGSGFFARHLARLGETQDARLVIAATLAAFVGAYVGKRLLHKTTLRSIQRLVGVLLVLLAVGIGTGLL